MVDMSTDYYQVSDKLSYEKHSVTAVYQANEFYTVAVEGVGGSEVSLYNHNLENVRTLSYEGVESLTDAINLFCDDMQFEGVDSLRNRSAELLQFGGFMQNYAEAHQRRETSIDMENQWYSNSEDSFAIFALNPTEHNEQTVGRDMNFLEIIGEDLDKRNFHCIYTDTITSLEQNDPMFYGETDMKQHLQQALAELEQGDGEKLNTMIQVKSPKFGEANDKLDIGCVLALKQEGEISNYFMDKIDLVKVEFIELLPKFKEKAVEEAKDQMYQDIYANSRTISDFVEKPLSNFDQSCINLLVEMAVDRKPEIQKKDLNLFVADAINDGFIAVKDFRNMNIVDFERAVADLERDNLMEFSSVLPDVNVMLRNVSAEQLVDMMAKDKNLESLVHQASQLSTISQNLESSVPFEDISAINDYAQDISTKYEEMDKGKVSDFIVDAIDNEVISVQDLENISYRDFFDAFQQEDKGILKDLTQAINHTEDKSLDNKSLDVGKDGELRQVHADIVAIPNEVDMFAATLTTQERVIVHRATDFIYDFFPDYSEDEKSVMADILDKVDTNSDLLDFYPSYPDDYVFDVNVELYEKTTIVFSGEELEMIAEVCDASSRSWDDITNDYRDLVDAVIEKVENPQLEPVADILNSLGNLAEEQKENAVAPRMVARSYEIIDSVVMGGEEIALGESPTGMAGTWERSIVADEDKGVVDNWYSGHYFSSKEEAVEDFHQRIEDKLEERESILGGSSIFSSKSDDSKGTDKDKGKDEEKKDSPRQSVLSKLKELKQELAPKENKEQPSKGKDNQTL